MNQLHQELLESPLVADVRARFEENDVPFDDIFEEAVRLAARRFTHFPPTVANVVVAVANTLEKHLREELQARPTKTRIGRLFGWVWRVGLSLCPILFPYHGQAAHPRGYAYTRHACSFSVTALARRNYSYQ